VSVSFEETEREFWNAPFYLKKYFFCAFLFLLKMVKIKVAGIFDFPDSRKD